MSRVINPESVGKERNRLSKGIVIAIRELMKQSEPNPLTKDLTAYIILSLEKLMKRSMSRLPLGKKRLLGQGGSFSHGMGMGQTHCHQAASPFHK